MTNEEVLKRQKELLLEIEALKIKNDRLGKLILDIKEVALGASKMFRSNNL
jgi:hypothetical protein